MSVQFAQTFRNQLIINIFHIFPSKWKDYPDTANSWEPAENIFDKDLIKEFDEEQKRLQEERKGEIMKTFSILTRSWFDFSVILEALKAKQEAAKRQVVNAVKLRPSAPINPTIDPIALKCQQVHTILGTQLNAGSCAEDETTNFSYICILTSGQVEKISREQANMYFPLKVIEHLQRRISFHNEEYTSSGETSKAAADMWKTKMNEDCTGF